MSFYNVYLSSSKLSGEAHGMGDLITAMKIFEATPDDGSWRNAHICSQCKSASKYVPGKDSLYHSFRIRHDVAIKLLEQVEFKWRKKIGLQKAEPIDWLRRIDANGEEFWFNLEFYEF